MSCDYTIVILGFQCLFNFLLLSVVSVLGVFCFKLMKFLGGGAKNTFNPLSLIGLPTNTTQSPQNDNTKHVDELARKLFEFADPNIVSEASDKDAPLTEDPEKAPMVAKLQSEPRSRRRPRNEFKQNATLLRSLADMSTKLLTSEFADKLNE